MTSLRRLVETPTLRERLSYLVRPRADAVVERVVLVEDLTELAAVDENALVLLTRAASAAVGTYRLDVALRQTRARHTAGVVVHAGDARRITATAPAIAERSGTAILGADQATDLADLAIAIARELSGGADQALMRTHAAVRAIAVHPRDGRPDSLVERAVALFGVPMWLTDDEPDEGPRTAVIVDGRVEAWLVAPPTTGDLAKGLDIVLHATANGVGAVLSSRRRAEELPIQSREEVLSELLAAPAPPPAALVSRSRTLGVPIDGWHVAVRIEFEGPGGGRPGKGHDGAFAPTRLTWPALHALPRGDGEWHTARSGLALMLLRMTHDDPGVGSAAAVARDVELVLDEMRARAGAVLLRCGVGGAHPGPAGLASSATEARAAMAAARMSGRPNVAVAFDSIGLRRTLVEWYATDTAQEAISAVLAPLTHLGARGERLIQTLHVYLDQRGSLTGAAAVLQMHRNSVAYRIDRAFELLDVDRKNPDDLLLLQLACRARELG